MTTSYAGSATGLLVVEGQNDEHLVLHLCRQANPGLGDQFDFHNAQGRMGVINSVRNLVNQPDLTGVGFVLDGDETPQEHWQQVIERIEVAYPDMQLPATPELSGTIIPADSAIDSPRIGVWIMPDNLNTGELEDFVERMIPASDPVWPLAQQYIAGIPSTERTFAQGKTLRAQIHAWLAAREDPRQMGLAILAHDLEINGPLCQRFLAWLTRLFG